MKMYRFDAVRIDSFKDTPEGYLRGRATVTRTGVFKYRNDDGSIRNELRKPEHIFNQASLDSMKGIVVTLDHPSVFVDSTNASRLAVGFTGETVSINNDEIVINFTITDKMAIDAVKAGKNQLSLGYELDLLVTEGITDNGEHYDGIQTNIVYNHLAIVDRARAGERARINLDGVEGKLIAIQINNDETQNGSKRMKTIKINGIDCKVEDSVAEAYEKEQAARADSEKNLKTQLGEHRARADVAQAELNELKTAEQTRIDTEAKKTLIEEAKPFLDKDFNFDASEILDVKKAVIGKVYPNVKLDGELEDSYINGLYTGALATKPKTETNNDGVRRQMIDMTPQINNDGQPAAQPQGAALNIRRDGTRKPTGREDQKVEDAQARFDAVMINGWKKPGLLNNCSTMAEAYNKLQPALV